MSIPLLWVIAGIATITLLVQWLAWWIKTPAILFLLLIGLLIGPVFGWFSPNEVFGNLLNPMISLSVAVILFEGSLTLNVQHIRGLEGVIRNLLTLGIAITWLLTAVFCHYLIGLTWAIALLLGAICTITGPTVVLPMLRTISPNQQLTNILRWESIGADPIGALLAIIVLAGTLTFQRHEPGLLFLLSSLETLVIGIGVGIVFGYFLGKALQLQWIPDFLHNVATLCIVLFAYALASSLKESAGLLSVTLMGLWLANRHEQIASDLLGFKESLSILLISGLFLLIAAQMNLSQTIQLILPACVILLTLQFIIRPISIACCTFKSELSFKEKLFLAWLAPKGIVSASVAALFVIQLENSQVAQASILLQLVLLIIIGTVLFQGVTALPLARKLGVCDPEPNGILIIGANPVAQSIGKALQDQGIRVLLTAFEWHHSHTARMSGLPIYYGNPISDHADRHLDLIGLGKLFSLSHYNDLNALAAVRYTKEFGKRDVYAMPVSDHHADSMSDKHDVAKRHHGRTLFTKDITLDSFQHTLNQGGAIRSTTLSDNFTLDDYNAQYGEQALLLFAINPKGRLHIYTSEQSPKPANGWTLISLIKSDLSS